jgi:peptidoglycan/xylan/chitin deacetylase (PgdA/CDA1 family)
MNIKSCIIRTIKTLLGKVVFSIGLNRIILSRCAVVIALHRVEASEEEDAMTMPSEKFRKWCTFFVEHFRVVSPVVIVEKLERGHRLSGELALTFDDGYLDFHSQAVPIMESMGVTAAVFAVSEFVGSDVVPWWDAVLNKRYLFMDWAHLLDVQERGFIVGSHGKTHAGINDLSPEDARDEITISKAALEVGLGCPVSLYAYPYGDHARMTEEARVFVRNAGYRACFGYGGLVWSGTSPFYIGRICINDWFDSPEYFGGHLVLLALRDILRSF